MKIEVKVWRQAGPQAAGRFENYAVEASEHLSLLDLLDLVNDSLVEQGREPIAYESDCREGICGACGVTVDGTPHGPVPRTPSCRQHLRSFSSTQITIEPFRSAAFPVVKDLIVDRSALTEAMAVGSVAVNAGSAPDADSLPSGHDEAEEALDFAACIGCGACVAACPNGSANLFGGAKLAHLALIPQGRVERKRRAREMTAVLDEHFGPCSSIGECEEVCPAGIDLRAIAAIGRERLWHW